MTDTTSDIANSAQEPAFRGLSAAEVEKSRRLHGTNILTPPAKTPLWKQFLEKFSDPLIIILLVAGVLSIGISFYEYYALNQGAGVFFEPAGIFMAILLATGLAFIFELKAEKEFALLNQVNDEEPVVVIRDGNATRIPRKDVVVGDIVILSAGEEVPADGELLEATSLSIDESSLTGEPICHKTTDPTQFDPDATFPSDHAMRGTKIMEGHGLMRVLAVGDATENGKVFEAAQLDDGLKTPLDTQLERLGSMITRIAYLIAAFIIVGRVLMFFINTPHFDWMLFLAYMLQTVMVAVTLVVVSVPEGLPMAVTLSLAYSMRRMLKTNNLVRKLHACETMGAITVICTDKTGTLTQNRMQVARMDFFGSDEEKKYFHEDIALNSTARLDRSRPRPEVLGNPTEGALLLWLDAEGEDYEKLRSEAKIIEELPFSTERKYMATLVEGDGSSDILYVKGAPEILLSMSADTGSATSEEINALLLDFQSRAMRTLGFAYLRVAKGTEIVKDGRLALSGLHFLGVAAISDPVRDDVPQAVQTVGDAGIKIKIVTGDTPATAKEIGRRIGLWDDSLDSDRNIITGDRFARLSDSELRQNAEDFKIIARARPLDKKRLVEALQARGEVVAVTGDGTNDAPALKSAQVGLSMGDGTSVAKEASDITIIDNSFASIGRAVMWGRSLYQNIRRFIMFQTTVNVVASLVVLVGAFLGMQSPLTVTQMLWVNLIMDTFAAMALASLPPSERVMRDKPRRASDFIISRPMWRSILAWGVSMFILLIGLLYYLGHTDITSLLQIGTASFGPYNGLSPYELSLFFTIFVFLQFWNMFNARAFATGQSALRLRGCSGFIFIAAAIFFGQILIVEVGGQFFNVVPLSITDWILIIAATSPVLWVGEAARLLRPTHRTKGVKP